MDTSHDITAKKRAQRSILLGLGSILGAPLAFAGWLFAILSSMGWPDWQVILLNLIFTGLLIACAGMGVACVVVAFTTPGILGSWQGKVAVVLAVLVALFVLTYLGPFIYELISDASLFSPP